MAAQVYFVPSRVKRKKGLIQRFCSLIDALGLPLSVDRPNLLGDNSIVALTIGDAARQPVAQRQHEPLAEHLVGCVD